MLLVMTLPLWNGACKKGIDHLPIPPEKTYDVSEYHLTYPYINDPATFPLLFRKTYDGSGKIVTEMDCSIFYPPPYSGPPLQEHDMIISHKGSIVYGVDKQNLTDTVMSVLLNGNGRPAQCTISADIDDNQYNRSGETDYFTYRDNRIFSIHSVLSPPAVDPSGRTDTVRYDSLGNVTSFGVFNYIYDYDRKIKEQFYITDIMQFDDGYYYLQYLGYFPEVTNPVNVRVSQVFTYPFLISNLTEEQFDSENKLIGYYCQPIVNSGGVGFAATTTWHQQ